MNMPKSSWTVYRCAVLSGCFAMVQVFYPPSAANAQDWENEVDFIQHSTYQAVNPDGTSAYAGGFPIKLRGVVLNNSEDWLDPTAAYDPEVHLWQLGGEAEFYVQAVDLPGDSWDNGDLGGTACWMGQNYGNHAMRQDPTFSYTDEEWYGELDRLHLWREGTTVSPLVRAGNLVEIRARAGLNYAGKMNVNEHHYKDPIKDFEIVILDESYGLPTPVGISLSAIKHATDVPIFDPTRATGGERYQSTLVEIQNVRFDDTADWGSDGNLTAIDGTGRTLNVHLGRNASFDAVTAPEGNFNVVGIMDQKSFPGIGGYQLLAMHPDDFSPANGAARIAARHVFYNDSAFDGNNSLANGHDDRAVAPDKSALLPGETATFENYTSYTKGINAVMVDIADLPPREGPLNPEDYFSFKVGNDDNPDGWADAPEPIDVSIRRGQGDDDSDRITIIWEDNAIQKEWLQVEVLANDRTGLLGPDVFYFGNAIGETGNSLVDAKVNASDMLGARDNQRTFFDPAEIDFPFDFDRDARVNATDMLIARNNVTHFFNALQLITVPGTKAAAVPEPSALTLLAMAAVALLVIRRKRRHNLPSE